MPDSSNPPTSTRRAQRWADEVRTRLAPVRLAPTREAEIVDELSQHLEDSYRERLAGGASPEEATRLSLADFRNGNVLAQYMAPLRQAHAPASITPGASTGQWLTDIAQDLRVATRTFWKQPAFAAATVLTLALGIGATTAIFSVVYGVLLKPLPFQDPEQLVSLQHHAPHGAGTNHGPATYLTYRENQRTFEGIGAWDPREVSVTGGGSPERVQALMVSASTLPLLRIEPVLGQLFRAEDEAPDSPLRVILTHGYWQRRFGGAADVLGRSIVVDGRPGEIHGVLPAAFTFLRTRPDLVMPMTLDAAAPRWIGFGFQALARLKPDATLAQANADVARMLSLLPAFARLELQPNVRPLADEVIGDVGEILWILLAAVAVVWLIACGNVANLFLVRAERRAQEFATRAALGASRIRVTSALLAESMVLALAGGAIGVGLAGITTRILRAIAPAGLPRVDEIGINAAVLLFTLAVTVLSGVLFGVFAAMRLGSPALTTLKDGGRAASDAPGRHRTRNTLVVAQVALALTLLIVSGLMVRTFLAIRQVDPGFSRPEDIQTFVIAIPPGPINDPPQTARAFALVADRLAQVPGVESVGLSSSITMDGEDNGNPIEVAGFPTAADRLPPLRRFKSVAPGYFETMGIPLAAGRSITWAEIHERRPVIMISEPLAREYWGEPARALGKRIRASQPDAAWREVVGVVGAERDDGLIRPPTAIVYWPMLNEEYRWRTMAYAVRSTRVGTPGFLPELARAVWSVDPNLPLANVQTLEEIQAASMTQTSFALVMLAIAAGVALLIAVVGIYGVVAYVAAQRTRETGVRMALGAQIGDIRRMFVRQGLALAAAGIAVGIVLALLVTRVMSTLLFGVGPMDPLTYAVVSAALASVTLLATYLPARGAARVDPIVALRANV